MASIAIEVLAKKGGVLQRGSNLIVRVYLSKCVLAHDSCRLGDLKSL